MKYNDKKSLVEWLSSLANKWQCSKPMQTPGKWFAAVSYQKCIYVIGGLTQNWDRRRRCRRLEKYPLQVRRKQNWGRGFILLLPQTATLSESDAGSGVIKPASSFVIQNRQTSCSMWCPMYRARC